MAKVYTLRSAGTIARKRESTDGKGFGGTFALSACSRCIAANAKAFERADSGAAFELGFAMVVGVEVVGCCVKAKTGKLRLVLFLDVGWDGIAGVSRRAASGTQWY